MRGQALGPAEKVDAVLESATLEAILRASGITVAEASKSKQTETTMRWKVGLAVPGRDDPVRTKIEFSGRASSEDRFEIEPIPQRVVAPYALRAPSVQHFLGEAMTEQKVVALSRRSATQARDVFDLDLLLRRHPLSLSSVPTEDVDRAAEQTLAAGELEIR